jgi:hypothetical protein
LVANWVGGGGGGAGAPGANAGPPAGDGGSGSYIASFAAIGGSQPDGLQVEVEEEILMVVLEDLEV